VVEERDVFDWVREELCGVFQAVDRDLIDRKEAKKRVRRVVRVFEARVLGMIPERVVVQHETVENNPRAIVDFRRIIYAAGLEFSASLGVLFAVVIILLLAQTLLFLFRVDRGGKSLYCILLHNTLGRLGVRENRRDPLACCESHVG